MTKSKKASNACIFFYAALYVVWAVLELWIVPSIESQMSPELMTILKETLLKLLIWLLPAVMLCRRYNNCLYIKYSELYSVRREFWKYIPILLLFTVILGTVAFVQHGQISVGDSFTLADVIAAVSIGVAEEVVFRGWLLNSQLSEKHKWAPVLLNSFLFLLIHFPIWIRNGVFLSYITSGLFIEIIILSIIFSWTFIKNRSLVVPIILHAYWDLLCFMFAL